MSRIFSKAPSLSNHLDEGMSRASFGGQPAKICSFRNFCGINPFSNSFLQEKMSVNCVSRLWIEAAACWRKTFGRWWVVHHWLRAEWALVQVNTCVFCLGVCVCIDCVKIECPILFVDKVAFRLCASQAHKEVRECCIYSVPSSPEHESLSTLPFIIIIIIVICFTDLKNWIKNRLAAALERCAMMHSRDKQFLWPLQVIAVNVHHMLSFFFFFLFSAHHFVCSITFLASHVRMHTCVQHTLMYSNGR